MRKEDTWDSNQEFLNAEESVTDRSSYDESRTSTVVRQN